MNWISVKTRLPEKGHGVLLTDGESAKEGSFKEMHGTVIEWDICDCCYHLNFSKITYWAELSDLPNDE